MEQKQTYTLVVGVIAILAIGVGVLWYAMRSTEKEPDFRSNAERFSTGERTIAGQSTNIIVYAPKVDERVGTPIVVEGSARVFENVVNYRLIDAAGTVIAEGFTTANAPDIGQFGEFRGELVYQSEVDGEGILEVFWHSAKDGTLTDVVSIPITYTKTPEFVKG